MSAPRIPNDINYWLKKGKSGKNVCLFMHDDLDGIVSCIIMKNYLIRQGFNIKRYGIVNYQEGWSAFKIDPTLINISLDYADDNLDISIYIDHHGKFTDEEKIAIQGKGHIKTETGSAAEGIAIQLGVPFSNDIKDWIDMIDSAAYSDYDIDVKGILDFDLDVIIKSKKPKLKFAAAMNQLLKRSDDRTFIEVVNASSEPSIYNIYRLFKLFYPKNNPDWKTGVEPEFVADAKTRLSTMQEKTKGSGLECEGFDSNGKKIIFKSQNQFWNAFAQMLDSDDVDDNGNVIKKAQVKPGVYQIIGNLMYVPTGTWANALRAKAIFNQDLDKGIVPDDPKLNFVLLQYGNTLQIADLRKKVKEMDENDLPRTKRGQIVHNLGKYTEELLNNFKFAINTKTGEKIFNYKSSKTVAGGHFGIGSISNIFGKCDVEGPYKNVKFLDLFKNKIISDISGVEWGLQMAWNEEEEKPVTVKPEEINKKMMNINDIRTEQEVKIFLLEREILNYFIVNNINKNYYIYKFKDDTIRKIYEIWLETDLYDISISELKPKDLEGIYFKKKAKIEDSIIFKKIEDKFNLTDIYLPGPSTDKTKKQRKELKRIFRIMFNIFENVYLKNDTEQKVKKWIKQK
jgi:hypothetical protein